MTITQPKIEWEPQVWAKYQGMLKKIPLFHRDIAQQVVEKKAAQNAQARGASRIEEVDIVDAFFSEVPKAFYSLMVRLLHEAGFDYGKHIRSSQKR